MVDRERHVSDTNIERETREAGIDFQELGRIGQELYEEGYYQLGSGSHCSPASTSNLYSKGYRGITSC
jgi:hypothetical protein